MNDFKNSKLAKNIRENRAVYITALTLLVALAVIITITAVANRSKKPADSTPPPTVTDAPDTDNKTPDSSEGPNSPASAIPELVLPTEGKLAKSHDAELQVFSNTMQDYRTHLGVDICTAENAEVKCVAKGIVAEIWDDPLMGKCVAVNHDGDAVSIYKNLSLTLAEGLEAGKSLEAGALLGYVGDTAMVELADEPHLHFELTVAGIQADPMEYFGEDAVATLAQDTSFEKAPAQE